MLKSPIQPGSRRRRRSQTRGSTVERSSSPPPSMPTLAPAISWSLVLIPLGPGHRLQLESHWTRQATFTEDRLGTSPQACCVRNL